MKIKTKVGQIFLTHPRDENFTSLYEEAFSKHGDTVELFAILDVSDLSLPQLKAKKKEYEKLIQIVVTAFKKAYIASPNITQETFEQALSSINSTISRILTKNKVSWYGKLNVAIGAIFRGQLAISITGSALVYMLRKGELTVLSEELTESGTAPVKLFSNYSVGKVHKNDRIIFSTKQIFNFLSLDRFREFLAEDTLEDSCKEIIAALQDVKTAGLATFICEITNGEYESKNAELVPETAAPSSQKSKREIESNFVKILQIAGNLIWSFSKFLLSIIFNFLRGIVGLIMALWRRDKSALARRDRKYKKYVFVAIALVLFVLLYNIGNAIWQKSQTTKQEENQSVLGEIEEHLNQAEASLIYNDENRALDLVGQAEKLFQNLSKKQAESATSLGERLRTLKSKINKETIIDNPTVLAQFPNIPTELLRSPDGFLGFNRNTQSLAFYDFRTGETKAILQNQNTSNLILGDFLGGSEGYVFLAKNGKFSKLNLAESSLAEYSGESPTIDPNLAKIQAISILGEGIGARIYLLDKTQNQIWRARGSESGFANPAEAWLKASGMSFGDALDIAIDSNVYVLFPDHIEKYFNGQRQNFELSLASPELKKAVSIFAKPEANLLYVADPKNQRVLIYNKSGKRERQITSTKFRDLADIYVDEEAGIMYALAGSELLQISLK